MESKENNRFGFNKVALDELLKKADREEEDFDEDLDEDVEEENEEKEEEDLEEEGYFDQNLTDFLQRKKEGPIRDKKVQKAVDSGVLHPEDAPAPYETIEHEDPLARQEAPNTL